MISFFWGVDKTYRKPRSAHPFPGGRLPGELREHRPDLSLPANPSLYIHAPARLDPSMAPPGQDTLIAIVPVGHLSENGEAGLGTASSGIRRGSMYFAGCELSASPILKRTSSSKKRYTPLSWAKRYNLVKGSTHGLSHRLTQMAYFRPSNRHPRYRNLYFVGASTHPGTGIPTAMVSGRLVSERIQEDSPMKVLIISTNTLPASPAGPVYLAGVVRQGGR